MDDIAAKDVSVKREISEMKSLKYREKGIYMNEQI